MAADNGGSGFLVSGGGSQMTVSHSVARGNDLSGFGVLSNAIIRVSNSVATNNGVGFENQMPAGTVESAGNSTVQGNTANTAGGISPAPGI